MIETRILIPNEERFYARRDDFLNWCLNKYDGYTSYGDTVGAWRNPADGKLYVDDMNCIGIAADEKCYEAAEYAKTLFEQEAIYCTFHEAEII